MGLAYFEMQDYNEAMTALQQAINLDKQCSNAMINLALVHKKLGSFDKAAQLL